MCQRFVTDRWSYKGFEICHAPSIATGQYPESFYVYLSPRQLYLCLDGVLRGSAWDYRVGERGWYASREQAEAQIDKYMEKV